LLLIFSQSWISGVIFVLAMSVVGILQWRNSFSWVPKNCRHLVDDFYKRYSTNIKLVEIRKERRLNVLHIPCDQSLGVLIFVHGSMGRMSQFSHLIDRLKSNYEILAFDMLGCGFSEKPKHSADCYAAAEHYKDFLKFLDRFVVDYGDIYFIGHSLGTSLCMKASLERGPPLGMVLFGTCIFEEGWKTPGIFALPNFLLYIIQPLLTEDFVFKAISKKSGEFVALESFYSNRNPPYVFKSLYTNYEWISEKEISSLECPILILNGSEDKIIPNNGNKIDELTPPETKVEYFEIQNAAHQIMQEQPEECIALMEEFFKSIYSDG